MMVDMKFELRLPVRTSNALTGQSGALTCTLFISLDSRAASDTRRSGRASEAKLMRSPAPGALIPSFFARPLDSLKRNS